MASKRRTKADLDLRLTEYDGDYLLCRDVRHSWEIDGACHEDGWVKRRLSCGRCETLRIDYLSGSGARYRSRYIYPAGYKLTGGVEHEKVVEEQLRRIEIFASEEEMLASLMAGSRR